MTRKDRLAKAHERLTEAVESLVGGNDWQKMLALAARLDRYSTDAGGVSKLHKRGA